MEIGLQLYAEKATALLGIWSRATSLAERATSLGETEGLCYSAKLQRYNAIQGRNWSLSIENALQRHHKRATALKNNALAP